MSEKCQKATLAAVGHRPSVLAARHVNCRRPIAEVGLAREGTGRRLTAAILAADVAGYSRLMGVDEAGKRRQFESARVARSLGFRRWCPTGRRSFLDEVAGAGPEAANAFAIFFA